MGREAEGQTRLVSGQRSLFLFATQETPLVHVRITDVCRSSRHHLASSSVQGGFHSFLPAFRETEKGGGAEHSSGAGWFLVLKSLESKTLHGAWRFMCGGVGWAGLQWGGVGGLLRTPAVPSSDTSLKPMKS